MECSLYMLHDKACCKTRLTWQVTCASSHHASVSMWGSGEETRTRKTKTSWPRHLPEEQEKGLLQPLLSGRRHWSWPLLLPTIVSTLVKYCHDGWARVSVNMPPFPGPWRVRSVYRGLAPAEDWLSGAELGPAPLGLGNPGSRDTDTVGSGSLVPLEFR